MSTSIFKKATSLFIEKWSNFKTVLPTLQNLIKNYFNNTDSQWFEGVFLHGPSTNNSIERFNRTIKDIYVDWRKSDISTFIGITISMLEDQSNKKRSHELIHLFEKIEYSFIEELDTHGFALRKIFEEDEFLYFAVVMNDLKFSFEKEYLHKLISLEFNNLHDMKTCFTKLYLLKAKKT